MTVHTRPFAPASMIDLIGGTPLIRLRAFGADTPGVELYAKAEFQNPGGSVKDRAAASILRDGERTGRLRDGVTILDATSGNTGIAYAMISAAHGYRLKLCMPANVTPERTRTLKAFGAELILTDPMEGTDGAIREARRLFAADPQRYFYADQYNNDANWRAHYETTGAGDHRADRGADHALRGRPRHERHLHGRRPPAAGAQSGHPADLGPARFADARRRRAQAHGDGDQAGHLRRSAGRRRRPDRDRGGLRIHAAAGVGSGHAGRRLERRRARRVARCWPRASARASS